MEWILFSLVAAAMFAGGNFLDKFIVEEQVSNPWDYVFSYGLVAWLFAGGLFFVTEIPELDNLFLFGLFSGFLVAWSGFFFARALKGTETSKMVILFQIIPLVAVFAGWLFLGQALEPIAWLAFALILIGGTITLLNRDGVTLFSKGALDIVLFSALWGIVFVITDYLLLHMTFFQYLFLQTLGLALSNFLFLLLPEIRETVSKHLFDRKKKYISMTLVNGVDFAGKMAIIYAISIASYVGLVTVVLQVQSVFSILIGAALTLLVPSIYKEDLSVRNISQKVLGSVIIFAGIALLFL